MKKYDLSNFADRLLVYYRIMIGFEAESYRYNTEELRKDLIELRRGNLRDFRWLVEHAVNGRTPQDDPNFLPWRQLPFHIHKVKECRGCGRPFYDVSRNGRLSFCHWIPYKRYNYSKGEYKPTLKNGIPVSFCQLRYDSLRHPAQNIRRGFYAGTEVD